MADFSALVAKRQNNKKNFSVKLEIKRSEVEGKSTRHDLLWIQQRCEPMREKKPPFKKTKTDDTHENKRKEFLVIMSPTSQRAGRFLPPCAQIRGQGSGWDLPCISQG